MRIGIVLLLSLLTSGCQLQQQVKEIFAEPKPEPELDCFIGRERLSGLLIQEGSSVKRGDKIGTIGTAHGAYYAHLHLEIRDKTEMSLGGGYSSNTKGYLDPTSFINKHRPAIYKPTTSLDLEVE